MNLQNNKIFILGAGASRELKFNATNMDIGRNLLETFTHFELGPLSDGFFYYVNEFNKILPKICKTAQGKALDENLADYIVNYYKNKFDDSITNTEILGNEKKSKKINIEELFRNIEEETSLNNAYIKLTLFNYIYNVFSMISNYCLSKYHHIFANYIVRNKWDVISFNWDILLEEAMYNTKLWNYKDGYGLEVENIFDIDIDGESYKMAQSHSESLILKPHGSINWYLKTNDKGGVIDDEKPTVFLLCEARSRGATNEKLKKFMDDHENVQYKNILIPPGKKSSDLKIYSKVWDLTKDRLEKADEIIVIGFSFNEFDDYVLDEFKKINFKKNVKINIVSPEGYLRIQKFSDIFRTDAKNIKVIHTKFSCYCEWIIQQNGMTDLQISERVEKESIMEKIEYIKEVLAKHKEELHKQHKVTKIGIFGSYVRGEQKQQSDIDILVELDEPVSLLNLVGLENFLTDILGMKADVVPKKDIRPELKEIILNEVIYL